MDDLDFPVRLVNDRQAHKTRKGDLVIIATFGWMNEEDARAWEPRPSPAARATHRYGSARCC